MYYKNKCSALVVFKNSLDKVTLSLSKNNSCPLPFLKKAKNKEDRESKENKEDTDRAKKTKKIEKAKKQGK